MIREPIVSGQFYPQKKDELKHLIEEFKPSATLKTSAKGIILPHAGYTYSGSVAITTVGKIIPRKKIIILGPNHTGLGHMFSLWAKGEWIIPSGHIHIDEELAKSILSEGDYIKEDYSAHISEHSIEVELPIIHYFFEDFQFVPIACKRTNLEGYNQVSSQIFEAIKKTKEDILLVASTDLTHYEADSTARKKDRLVIEAIINLDEQELIKKIHKSNITMCGEAPVAILISCLKKLKAKKAQVALYKTSGDYSGDYDSVVGYVGMFIS